MTPTEADVLRWGHARREVLRRLGRRPPAWVAALDREYHRRRYVWNRAFPALRAPVRAGQPLADVNARGETC